MLDGGRTPMEGSRKIIVNKGMTAVQLRVLRNLELSSSSRYRQGDMLNNENFSYECKDLLRKSNFSFFRAFPVSAFS